ncbi:uncharacterized protein LOC123217927 isoform X2 [Mangifera indica]|uniref:uncharacterized protein LOC123217927 isoform X2 n=1 Tax=Mangifera indica TaxID=29780 RepID=UPI001CFB13C1|nr:uncharacterized protein LOC123217927 isoform X2 [Mangifera indica]
MGSVTEFSSGNPNLPWLWIIEYAASFKQVDTSVLHDLVEMAPQLPDDLAKNTTGMVALRCLEDMFGDANEHINDFLSETEVKVGFALSESCEDVLQRILQETPASDLKMDGPEWLKWDVHPFIIHKRAFMPKCALQQLKDMILEGNNPLAASLKESSGLMCVNRSGRIHTDDVNHNARTWRFNETGAHVQTTSMNESLILPTCENVNELTGDNLHNTKILPSKRNRKESNTLADDENMAGDINENQGEFDLHSNVKNLKQDTKFANLSIQQHSVPCLQLMENIPERIVRVNEGEDCDVANKYQDASMEESQFPEDGCAERLGQNGQNGDLNDDQIKHNQTIVNHIPDKMPRALLQTQRNDYADESRGHSEPLHEEELSSDNDEYLNERIDVAKRKSRFFSSQCLGNDFLAASSLTEQNLCVKCNKDGQLLVCHTSSCPLVVHEDCLGCPANFDETGNFYCPFCAYSLAISEYLEAKKKASIARKRLAAFFHKSLEQHSKEPAKELHGKGQTHSRQNGNKEIFENSHLGGREHNQVNLNGQHVHDLSDHLCQESIGNRNQSEPSASCFKNNLHWSEEMENVVSATVCVSNREKVGKENTVKEFPSLKLLGEQQDQAQANWRSDDDNLTCRDIVVAPVDLRDAEGENDMFSNYSIRVRRQERQYTYPAIPQLRRKKVPWTAKEEEMLKKGVRRFTTSVNDRNIPWKMILEFGSSVFLKGRTAIDLKDKWRNMCKGSPRAK